MSVRKCWICNAEHDLDAACKQSPGARAERAASGFGRNSSLFGEPVGTRKLLPRDWPRIWGVDFGYTNPFVWQMWAIDPDGRMYLERVHGQPGRPRHDDA